MRLLKASLLLVLSISVPAWADSPAELIHKLRDPKLETREAARRDLQKLGIQAILDVSARPPRFAVIRDAQGRIKLYGSECWRVRREAEAMAQWRKNLGQPEAPSIKDEDLQVERETGDCWVEITPRAPKIVQETHMQCSPSTGPNCWNAALVAQGILPFLRFSSEEEMRFWTTSPLCRAMRQEEPRRPGDIIAMRIRGQESAEYRREWHGAVYISEELMFSKNGAPAENPYAIQSTASVYRAYGLAFENDPRLQRCKNVEVPPKDCKIWSTAYRCQSMEEFLSSQPEEIRTEYSDLESKLHGLECSMSSRLMESKDPFTAEARRSLFHALDAVRMQIQTPGQPIFAFPDLGVARSCDAGAENMDPGQCQALLKQALVFRIRALQEQLAILSE